jgi:hypothetical protein
MLFFLLLKKILYIILRSFDGLMIKFKLNKNN